MLRNFDLPEAVVFYGTDSAVDAGGGAGRPGVTRILDECADVGTAAILLTETLRIEELEGLVMATEGLAPYVSDGTLRLRSSLDVDSAAFPPEALEEDPRLPFGRGGTGHAPSPAALLDAFLSVVVSPRGFGGSSGFGTKDEGPPSRPPLPKHVVALVSGPGRLSRARCSACRMAGVRVVYVGSSPTSSAAPAAPSPTTRISTELAAVARSWGSTGDASASEYSLRLHPVSRRALSFREEEWAHGRGRVRTIPRRDLGGGETGGDDGDRGESGPFAKETFRSEADGEQFP